MGQVLPSSATGVPKAARAKATLGLAGEGPEGNTLALSGGAAWYHRSGRQQGPGPEATEPIWSLVTDSWVTQGWGGVGGCRLSGWGLSDTRPIGPALFLPGLVCGENDPPVRRARAEGPSAGAGRSSAPPMRCVSPDPGRACQAQLCRRRWWLRAAGRAKSWRRCPCAPLGSRAGPDTVPCSRAEAWPGERSFWRALSTARPPGVRSVIKIPGIGAGGFRNRNFCWSCSCDIGLYNYSSLDGA